MAWFKVDDGLLDHPKFRALMVDPKLTGVEAMAAAWLWVEANCFAERHLTDGYISRTELSALVQRRGGSTQREALASKLADALIRATADRKAGLLETAEGGYVIHDFLDWHRSKEERQALTANRRSAGKIGGRRSGEVRSGREPGAEDEARASADREANAAAPGSRERRQNPPISPVSDASTNGRPVHPPEAFNHGRDCAWPGRCVNAEYFDAHPDSGLPVRGTDGQDRVRPKQCPHHREQDTPAW